MTFVWAYIAGALTLINPCVLPLLPIVIASAFQSSRYGPVALAGGLTASFAIVGVGVTAFGYLLGIDDHIVNRAAALIMIGFGVVLVLPRAQGWLSGFAAPLASGANDQLERGEGASGFGQFGIGVLLGAVWSPCIGPTLGGAISLAASGADLVEATLTMLAFGIGVSTILIALAYGSREALSARKARLGRWMPWAKPVRGVTLMIIGVAIVFHCDRVIESWLLDIMPIWLQDLSVAL